ncbi:hypothetical protein CABS01_02120 [Colletotrichum abscissum]|uniref:uncharacterized protein n=1 Tax=Colletotrichum abscissum TaxID=1671311 RepID=UPI0027D66A41|nr:uncharacterized protein CABS01_02120 [Colletotrichum abscissum]KAK1488490.1 hypothetical protein CABS01_02120 [Colletotrichum abscissum]
MATLLQMLKSVVTRFQIPSHQYMSIGEGVNKTPSRLERVWKHGKVHIFYIFLMIALVVLNRHASPPLHQQTLYGEEPVRSEIRLKNEPRIFDLDEDYAMPPSISVNNAWSSLIPKEGGFFEHPAITSGARKATGKIPHMPRPIKNTAVQIPPQMPTPLMTYTMLAIALISYAKPSCAAP